MTNYEVKFYNNSEYSTVTVEAANKSEAIEKVWELVGIMIVIKEIVEVGN